MCNRRVGVRDAASRVIVALGTVAEMAGDGQKDERPERIRGRRCSSVKAATSWASMMLIDHLVGRISRFFKVIQQHRCIMVMRCRLSTDIV